MYFESISIFYIKSRNAGIEEATHAADMKLIHLPYDFVCAIDHSKYLVYRGKWIDRRMEK